MVELGGTCGRLVAFLVALLSLTASSFAAERPNVILIVTDDQGYGDFGVTGNEVIATPHIDTLARKSASMGSFYVSPVCSPTRASLMTGRYNYRTRVIDTYQGRSMLDPNEITIAEILKDAGYATGIFGKWHLGDCYPMRAHDRGFETALVIRGGGLAQASDPPENERRYTNPILFRNGKPETANGYCTDVYFDEAMKFIEQAKQNERNFFVAIPTNAPHGPFHDVPEEHYKKYAANADAIESLFTSLPQNPEARARQIDHLARIAAMITNVDDNVGRLLEKLDSLGLNENTIVIYMIDNGPDGFRYVGSFRGKKAEVYEGGIRSPLWIHYPEKLKPGEASKAPVAHIDLMPTLLEACGVAVPEELKLDGRSFWKLLTRETDEWPERSIVIQSHRGNVPKPLHHFMIRRGDWKLLHPSGFGNENFAGEPKFELYNVAEDPGETKNLIDEHPELAAQLKEAYLQWFDDVSTTRPNNYAPPRIVIGSKHENPTILTRQDWRSADWEPNANGHWLLEVERAGKYEFRFHFTPAKEDEVLSIRIVGGGDSVLFLEPGAAEEVIENEELAAGPTELRVELKHGEKIRSVHQVTITRLED